MAIDGPRSPDDGDDKAERPPRRSEGVPDKGPPAINLEGTRMFGSRAEHRAEAERLTHDRRHPGPRPPDVGAADDSPTGRPSSSDDAPVDQPERTDDRPDSPIARRDDLYAFGNKERIRPLRLERDLRVDSPDSIVGPCSPSSPRDDDVVGQSAYIDPDLAPLLGHFYVLPKDVKLPPGLGIHADGEDAGGRSGWGHRLIYPTEAMTASQFQDLVDSLNWTWSGNKKEPKQ